MTQSSFDGTFEALTHNKPFPWQQALYQRFATGDIPPSCNLPTGLGKTSVIAVWLIALANGANVPRRLVYVVNRRTVVDQTTDEVEKYKRNAVPGIPDFAVSTLRGQFADNREWSADPSRPAVICGTVDMIGSRLLFSGYGVGMKARPLHAGFLGQDALLIHDEAHLEPAFQKLIETIRDEQGRCQDFRPLRVMELTATSRGGVEKFGLTDQDENHSVVKERINASKALHLHSLDDPKKLADQLAAKAKEFADRGRAVLVFALTVENVLKVAGKMPQDRVVTLTGTMRGKERDALVEHPLFKRFLPGGQSDESTTYLVCTSAGEVGVNISADHLVCDLTPFDSMAQRFGRVNRFGQCDDTEIHVLHPAKFEEKDYEQQRAKTLELLRKLNGDACPAALSRLDAAEAFTPIPTLLPATDILFDAWALTTITGKLPGRPPVEPYLHGIAEWQPPETQVAWREEVERITGDLLNEYKPADLLDDYPLKPHELLKDSMTRVRGSLEQLAEAQPNKPAWVVDEQGNVMVTTLEALSRKEKRNNRSEYAIDSHSCTILLPPSAGGLNQGMLDGNAPAPEKGSLDVADTADRRRVWNDDPIPEGMHAVLTIRFPGADEDDPGDEWNWCKVHNPGDRSAQQPVLWEVHVEDVKSEAKKILEKLNLPAGLRQAVETAAALHDHGKRRTVFQTILGNRQYPSVVLAKSGKKGGRFNEHYRHEFGSLLDVEKELTGEQRDLILHLIAAHHGRARPHFPLDEAFDPERSGADAERLAAEVPRRFARLQRKYGRWGLAYLESLLRAADWAASALPSAFVEDKK